MPSAQVALGADRGHRERVRGVLFGQPDHAGVFGVLERHGAVANVAIEAEGGELAILIHAGSVAPGAAVGKAILVPGGFFQIDPPLRFSIRAEYGLCVEESEFSVAFFVQEADAMAAAKKVIYFRR